MNWLPVLAASVLCTSTARANEVDVHDGGAPIESPVTRERAGSIGLGADVGVGLGGGAFPTFSVAPFEGRKFFHEKLSLDLQTDWFETVLGAVLGLGFDLNVSSYAHFRFPVSARTEFAVAPGGRLDAGTGVDAFGVAPLFGAQALCRVGVDFLLHDKAMEVGLYLRPGAGVGVFGGSAVGLGSVVVETTFVWNLFRR